MNKTFLFIMAALCCALFSSCGDDGEGAQEVSNQTGVYSNYAHENSNVNLTLLYNEENVIDKELKLFKPLYSDTCELTLVNVLTTSDVIFRNVVLSGGPDGEVQQQYSFQVDTVIGSKKIHCAGKIGSPNSVDQIVGAAADKANATMTLSVTETNAE